MGFAGRGRSYTVPDPVDEASEDTALCFYVLSAGALSGRAPVISDGPCEDSHESTLAELQPKEPEQQDRCVRSKGRILRPIRAKCPSLSHSFLV